MPSKDNKNPSINLCGRKVTATRLILITEKSLVEGKRENDSEEEKKRKTRCRLMVNYQLNYS